MRWKITVPPCPPNANCTLPLVTNCLPGFGFEQTWTPCVACPPGTFKAVQDRNPCTPCPNGWVQPLSGQTSCIPDGCPANMTCTVDGIMMCSPGFYLNNQTGQCTPCDPGSFKSSAGNATACDQCASGTSQPSGGQTSCVSCSAGSTYQSGPGQNQCLACPSNSLCTLTSFSCNPGYYYDVNNGCMACAAGSFKSTYGLTICTPCSAGSYQPYTARSSCINVQLGVNYQPNFGQTTALTCPANSFCNATSFQCNAGFGFNGTQCVPCAAGTAKSTLGNVPCQACLSTTYQSNIGQSSCLPCPSGADCSALSTYTCMAGYGYYSGLCVDCTTLSAYKTSSGNTLCQPCPAGAICSATSFTCQAGFGVWNGLWCLPCDGTNTFKPTAGNSVCVPCPSLYKCTSSSLICASGFMPNGDQSACVLTNMTAVLSTTPSPTPTLTPTQQPAQFIIRTTTNNAVTNDPMTSSTHSNPPPSEPTNTNPVPGPPPPAPAPAPSPPPFDSGSSNSDVSINSTLLYAIIGSAGFLAVIVVITAAIIVIMIQRRHNQVMNSKSYQSLITATNTVQSRRGSTVHAGIGGSRMTGTTMSTTGYHAESGLGTIGIHGNRRTSTAIA